MRRIGTTLLAAVILLAGLSLPAAASETPAQSPPAPAPAGFADLPATHWAQSAVVSLTGAGVIAGDPGGLFRPHDPVRRSELIKMVLTARRIDVGTKCQSIFVDAPCAAWYTPYAETAYRMAITDGQSAEHFAPDIPVTRQELFTVIIRVLGRRWEAADQSYATIRQRLAAFSDRGQIADWAEPAVALAVADGIATGNGDGTFRPKALASRAEAAAAISRILVPVEQTGTVEVDGRKIVFSRHLAMTASAYATGEPGVGTITYTGVTVRPGTVAVDPTVIPLGRLLYVEGYGYAVAADIGSAIKGNRIDLYTPSYEEAAYHFGLQGRKVWVLP